MNQGGDHYYGELVGEDGEVIRVGNRSAHCLACAKVDFLVSVSEPTRVDLRGWHKYEGICGSFLYSMQMGILEEGLE